MKLQMKDAGIPELQAELSQARPVLAGVEATGLCFYGVAQERTADLYLDPSFPEVRQVAAWIASVTATGWQDPWLVMVERLAQYDEVNVGIHRKRRTPEGLTRLAQLVRFLLLAYEGRIDFSQVQVPVETVVGPEALEREMGRYRGSPGRTDIDISAYRRALSERMVAREQERLAEREREASRMSAIAVEGPLFWTWDMRNLPVWTVTRNTGSGTPHRVRYQVLPDERAWRLTCDCGSWVTNQRRVEGQFRTCPHVDEVCGMGWPVGEEFSQAMREVRNAYENAMGRCEDAGGRERALQECFRVELSRRQHQSENDRRITAVREAWEQGNQNEAAPL